MFERFLQPGGEGGEEACATKGRWVGGERRRWKKGEMTVRSLKKEKWDKWVIFFEEEEEEESLGETERKWGAVGRDVNI